jgi:hypothetical protein
MRVGYFGLVLYLRLFGDFQQDGWRLYELLVEDA